MSTHVTIHGNDEKNTTSVRFMESPTSDHSWLTIELNKEIVTFHVGTMTDQEVINFADQFTDALMAMVTHREEKIEAELEALEQKAGK